MTLTECIIKQSNPTTPYRSWVAANSMAFGPGTLVSRASDGFAQVAAAGETLLGVSASDFTSASDNETVAQKKVVTKFVDGELGERMLIRVAGGVTIDFSADLVTSNTINLKVNGTAMTQVTFAVDNATTLAAIATQLETDFPELIADAYGITANDAVAITPQDGVTITITDIVVAAGASQATGAQVDTVDKADEGDFYDIDTTTQKLDGGTNHASSGQLKLERYISQSLAEVSIANT